MGVVVYGRRSHPTIFAEEFESDKAVVNLVDAELRSFGEFHRHLVTSAVR